MPSTYSSHLTGAGRAAGLVAGLVVGYVGPHVPAAVTTVGGDDFPAAAIAVVDLTAVTIAGWVLLVIAGHSVRLRVPGVPAPVRALLFTTVVVAAVTSPAHADNSRDLTGLTLPDRPMSAASAPAPAQQVTVSAGDTLWAIAAEHLPADASNPTIARACAQWHSHNRAVIGPDPDLILPGQVLHPPVTEQDAS